MESHGGVLLQRDGGAEQAGRQTHLSGHRRGLRKTFQIARGIIADVFLAPHPEMFKMEDKRPLIGKYGVNPFIKAGEFHAYIRETEKAFDEASPSKRRPRKLRSRAGTPGTRPSS